MTISLVCPQERLSLYKFSPSAYPLCSKGLGHLLHLGTIYFPCIYFLVAYTRKPIKSYLSVLAVIPCSRSLVSTFCSSLGSTLLLIDIMNAKTSHTRSIYVSRGYIPARWTGSKLGSINIIEFGNRQRLGPHVTSRMTYLGSWEVLTRCVSHTR